MPPPATDCGMEASANDSSSSSKKVPSRLYSISKPPSLSTFKEVCSQKTDPLTYPLAQSVKMNIPLYDLSSPNFCSPSPSTISDLQDEWHHILVSGPGVLVLKVMYSPSLLKTVNSVFDSIIASEKASGTGKGDHFASTGSNDRVWNSFSKHGLADPSSFISYYSNPWLSYMSKAWLGPAYCITAQINVINPGGQAQACHRDYHLGFQSQESCAQYPSATHLASQFLTLQGAVAHSDMPLESGPTRFLPFSQMFAEGFMAYRLDDFINYFNDSYVSLPLEMGDAVFFNPALFHAAGENKTTGFRRKANLLQISSPFGKPMESIDSIPLIENCWDILVQKFKDEGLNEEVMSFVRAVGEGYPFPTNLDRRPPAPSGMAPESEQDLLFRGIWEGWMTYEVCGELRKLREDGKA